MASTDVARSRLSAAIDARRIELRLQWDELARLAGISVAHLRHIRKGEISASPLIWAGLAAALRWKFESLEEIEAGRQPIPLDEPVRGRPQGITLGQLLVERGINLPEELGVSDDIRDDPVALEILEMDLPEDQINRMLKIYADMRRNIFIEVRGHNKRRPS